VCTNRSYNLVLTIDETNIRITNDFGFYHSYPQSALPEPLYELVTSCLEHDSYLLSQLKQNVKEKVN
jgi:hypothetical protein